MIYFILTIGTALHLLGRSQRIRPTQQVHCGRRHLGVAQHLQALEMEATFAELPVIGPGTVSRRVVVPRSVLRALNLTPKEF